MAHVWKKNPAGWTALELDACWVALGTCGGGAGDARTAGAGAASIRRASTTLGEDWLLLCGSGAGVTLNGHALRTGLALLRDRDEIRIAGDPSPLFFSTQSLAMAETFAGAGDAAGFRCPRCRHRIEPGATIVRCPGCGVLHHEDEELPCWTYAERCSVCPQATRLGDDRRWSPEDL